jgi:hypothetical protein
VFHGQGGSEVDEDAKWLAGYILTRGKEDIDEREIYRAYPRLRKPEDRWGIANAMHVLELQGWVTPTKERKGKDTAWRINPAVNDGRFAKITELERARRAEAREKIARGGKARALERA